MPRDGADRVLIVGAGPVGLGAALELARCGVRSVLIEKHDSTSWHPKTRNFNTRTMEIARGWGTLVSQRLRSIDVPPGWKSPIRFLRTATGEQLGVIESKGFEGPGPDVSPAWPVMSSQELIEAILLDGVRASGMVDVRFATEAIRLVRGGSPGDETVALEVRSRQTGGTETLTGPALVAADGSASLIRSELGLELEGAKELRHIVNCYFRADIERHLGDRKGVLFFVANEHAAGVLQPLDAAGRWLCQIAVSPEDWSLDAFTHERARAWIRAAVGVDGLEPEVLSLGLWKLNATVVERLVQGRVLLCGDAAHQFPPTGGLGVNTGLQGMHNAMWKLAWFVRGLAGWPLVETYEAERRGVAQRITSQSLQNSINVAMVTAAAAQGAEGPLGAEQAVAEARRYGNHLGVEFGVVYQSRAVIPDGTEPPTVADDYSDYAPSATPGARAPHVWLGGAEARLSTLDLFGSGLTVLAGPDGGAWCSAAAEAERELGVTIDRYRVGAPGLRDLGGFTRAYGVGDDGAVLVRPDGHVAWRSATGPRSGAALGDAVRQILGRLVPPIPPGPSASSTVTPSGPERKISFRSWKTIISFRGWTPFARGRASSPSRSSTARQTWLKPSLARLPAWGSGAGSGWSARDDHRPILLEPQQAEEAPGRPEVPHHYRDVVEVLRHGRMPRESATTSEGVHGTAAAGVRMPPPALAPVPPRGRRQARETP